MEWLVLILPAYAIWHAWATTPNNNPHENGTCLCCKRRGERE